jgi:hypothetical protein
MDSVAFDLQDMSVFRTDLGVTYTAIAVGNNGRVFWGGTGDALGGLTLTATPGNRYIHLNVHNGYTSAVNATIEKSADCPEGEWSVLTALNNIPPGGDASYDDIWAQNAIYYYYRIQASLRTGYDVQCMPNNGFTLPPPPNPPSALSVSDVAGDQGGVLNLTWTSNLLSTANTCIYRSDAGPGGPYMCIATVSTVSGQCSWNDQNALTGQLKYYYIRNRASQNGGGAGDWHYSAACASASGTASDNTAPGTPSGLTGQDDVNINRVRLMWSLATERDVAGWDIYRSSSSGGTYSKINNTPIPRPSYLDAPGGGLWWYYKIKAVDRSGNASAFSSYVGLYHGNPQLGPGGGQSAGLAEGGWDYALYPAFPNPSGSDAVGISYSLPEEAKVSLVVYDVRGRKVKTLVSGSENPGLRSVSWNGRDDTGKPVSGGVYFYRLEAGAFSQTRKLVLVR